jgi:hypothetical protein
MIQPKQIESFAGPNCSNSRQTVMALALQSGICGLAGFCTDSLVILCSGARTGCDGKNVDATRVLQTNVFAAGSDHSNLAEIIVGFVRIQHFDHASTITNKT